MRKSINSATQKFEDQITEELVLDAVPTVNSFNGVTSDGVARAIAGASGEVPQVTESDNGKVLTAIYDEGGPAVEWGEGVTVDQTYDATSTNAQSGVAVASAIASASGVFWAEYGVTTFDDIYDAAMAGKPVCLCGAGERPVDPSSPSPTFEYATLQRIEKSPLNPSASRAEFSRTLKGGDGTAITLFKVDGNDNWGADERLGSFVPSPSSADEGKVLTVDSTGSMAWDTPAAPSGGDSDEWWGGDPGRITLPAQTVRLKFKDLSYDPRNETDTSFTAHFQSITKVEDGVYDFLFASVASGPYAGDPLFSDAFKDKYLVGSEFVVLAFNFTTATYGKNKDAYDIFSGCTGLCAAYNIQDSDAAQNRNGSLSYAFYGCTGLKYFSVLERGAAGSLDYRIASVNNMSSMFSGCTSLVDCNMEIVRISGTADCSYMFDGCRSLVTGPAIMTGISSATRMFYNCVALIGLHTNYSLGEFDINPDTTCACASMFDGCRSLVTADMPFFMYYKISNLESMFQLCTSLRVPPRHIKVASGVSAGYMFARCQVLESLPIMDYGLVTNATYMFKDCAMLPDISPLSAVTWNASLVNVDMMFSQCWSIEKGLKDAYDNMAATATITSHSNTFKGCGTAFSNPDLAQIPNSWGGTAT